MRVTLETFGGFAAGIRRLRRQLDSAALPAPLAAELTRLSTAAQSEQAPGELPGPARDILTYKITLDYNGRTAILKASDAAMPPAFAALLDWLEEHLN